MTKYSNSRGALLIVRRQIGGRSAMRCCPGAHFGGNSLGAVEISDTVAVAILWLAKARKFDFYWDRWCACGSWLFAVAGGEIEERFAFCVA